MKFTLLPVIDDMLSLYSLPRGQERFTTYLQLLQGELKGDLSKPLGGFNPMAKEHVREQLEAMKKMEVEKLIAGTLDEINRKAVDSKSVFQVALNLSDDLMGGWTNLYVSDYQSKFRLSALIRRRFCVVMFRTSESVTENLIRLRTRSACQRSIYASQHGALSTLREHLLQEQYVMQNAGGEYSATQEPERCKELYTQHLETQDESLLLDLLYGDPAALSLGRKPSGLREEFAGFRYLRYLIDHGLDL